MPTIVAPDPSDAAAIRQFLGQHLRLLRAACPQDNRRDLDAAQMATAAFPMVQTAPILEAIAIVDRGVAEVQKANVTRFATWLFPSVLDHMRREHGLWASLLQGGLDLEALSTLAEGHGRDVALVTAHLLDPGAPTNAPLIAGLTDMGGQMNGIPKSDGSVVWHLTQLNARLHLPEMVAAPKAMPTWWAAHEDAENAALILWLRRGMASAPAGGKGG